MVNGATAQRGTPPPARLPIHDGDGAPRQRHRVTSSSVRGAAPALASAAMLRQSSWWQCSGGVYLIALVALTSCLGVATFLACAVAGQMLVALLLDHYSLLGFPASGLEQRGRG